MSVPGESVPGCENHSAGAGGGSGPSTLKLSKEAHVAGAESGWGRGGSEIREVTGTWGTSEGLWLESEEDEPRGGCESGQCLRWPFKDSPPVQKEP